MKKSILMLLLLVTACIKSSPKSSILEKSSCELPCWNGIVAGHTTEADLIQILDNLPVVDQRSIQNTGQPWSIFDNKIYFAIHQDSSAYQPSKIRGYAYLTDGIVRELTICGEIHTSMGDIVEAIGKPESILSGDNIEHPRRLVMLINSKKGISYSYTAQKSRNSRRYEIAPDVPIDCINLFDPTFYGKLLDAGLFANGNLSAQEALKVMYPWHGYGDLDEKYPPRQP